MKLIDYARKNGSSYKTVWRWYKTGKLQCQQMATGTILIDEAMPRTEPVAKDVAIYTRVSSAENKSNLDSQAERLVVYCTIRGYVMLSTNTCRWSSIR